MQILHSKTFEIFKTFSKTEILEFKIFLKNISFNESSIICEMYNEVVKLYPNRISEEVLTSLQKKPKFKNYSIASLRQFAYRLNKRAQEFLVYNNFKRDPYLKNELLFNELLSRKLDEPFIKRFHSFMDMLKDKQKNVTGYYKDYVLKSMLFNYNERNSKLTRHEEGARKINEIEKCNNSLTIYFFIETVSNYVTFIIDTNGYGIDSGKLKIFDTGIIEKLYNQLKASDDKIIPLYYLLYKTYSSLGNLDSYVKYRDYAFETLQDLHVEFKQYHFEYLYKYCTIKWTSQESGIDFREELFKLYKFYLTNRFYISNENKYARTTMIINVIKLSAELKNFDMIKKFLKENSSDINPVDRDIVSSYAAAYEDFTYGNFDKALAVISDVPLENYSYKYEVKMLIIRSMYELDQKELSLANIKAYRKFLRKDQFLNDEIKTITKNFLYYLEFLILMAHKKDKIEYSLAKLKSESKVCHKEWLIKKYEGCL